MELTSFSYTLKRSRRRRTIALRVEPGGAVRVSAPFFAPQIWIQRVVQKNWPWVLRKQAQFAGAPKYPIRQFISGELFPVWGEESPLTVQHDPELKKPVCSRDEHGLRMSLPASLKQSQQKTIQHTLRLWYGQETETRIADTIGALSARMGVTYNTFKVSYPKSRWGSCSRQGHLRFNGRLSLFPPTALEYVIVHELAHLKEANHSARFWNLVASMIPDFKERRRVLRQTTWHFLF